MMSMNLTHIATNYSCIITGISKSKATKLLENIYLTEKSRTF